ncbi:MAG: hypothetical protein Q8P95_05085, partial [bacterium]|nr:hypothetical protein [bacterium]
MPLLKMSAKKSFQLLRERSPFFCDALGVEVQVTKMFFRHITYARERQDVELIRRLLMVPFIDEILEKGQL